MSVSFSQVNEGDAPTSVILDQTDYGDRKLPNSVTEVVFLGTKYPVYNGCLLTCLSPYSDLTTFPYGIFSGLPSQFRHVGREINSLASCRNVTSTSIKNYYPLDVVPTNGNIIKEYRHFELNRDYVHPGLERVIGALTVDDVDFLLSNCPDLKAVGVVNPTPVLLGTLSQRNIEVFQFEIDVSLNPGATGPSA